MEFPSYDIPAGAVPGAAAPASSPAPAPSPVADSSPAPSSSAPAVDPQQATPPPAPAADIEAANDPLFAPFKHQQASAPAADPAASAPAAGSHAAPAQPDPAAAPAALQLTPEQQAIVNQGNLLATLVTMLQRPTQPAEPGAPPPPARDPKDIALEAQLVKRVPALGMLVNIVNDPQKAQAFQALLDAAPQHQATVSTFYEQYADRTIDKLSTFYGEAYGIEADKVSKADQDFLSEQFQLWAGRPGNERELQRYEAGDLTVVDRFTTFFRQRFVDPARRQGQQQVAARLAPVQNLPRGGGSTIPTPQQSARPVASPTGERDVFGEAWGELIQRRGA